MAERKEPQCLDAARRFGEQRRERVPGFRKELLVAREIGVSANKERHVLQAMAEDWTGHLIAQMIEFNEAHAQGESFDFWDFFPAFWNL